MSIPLNDCPHDTILLRTATVYLASRYAKYYRARENTWYLCVSYVREKLTNQINTGCCTRIVQKCTWDQPRVAVDSQSRGRSEAGSSRQAQGAVKTTSVVQLSAGTLQTVLCKVYEYTYSYNTAGCTYEYLPMAAALALDCSYTYSSSINSTTAISGGMFCRYYCCCFIRVCHRYYSAQQ